MRCFMRKRLLIVFSVLLFLLCLSVVSATDENTNSSIVAQDYDGNEFYVDLGGDDSNSGQLNSPFNSINKAVEVSKSNDNVVIHLGEGTFEGNGNVMISINKAHLSQGGSITIVGAGADKTIIKGSSAYYAFNIYADSVVTLRDLSIVDCKSVEGGAICNSGTLLVDNCIFRNNFAFNTGGAISSIENGDCKIYNSVFINNSVICNDEYENANGGAIYHDYGVLTLKDCIFENNKADDGDDIYGYIAPNGLTGGSCLNMSNTLTLVSTSSSNVKSELKAIFDLGGLKVSGYNIKFYLNGVYKGSAPLVNGVATFVAVANDGKYEISASGDYINKTTVVKGVLNVDANPVSVFDVYVSGTGSDESGDGSLAKPFATIKKAFEYGMSQNTLSLTIHIIGTLKGEGNVNLDLAPLIDLTIVGENKETSIIDAEKNKYIFDFTPAYDNVKVYLKNLTIKNGVTTTYPT